MNYSEWKNYTLDDRIRTVQSIITSYHTKKPSSHYLNAYRDEETSYWLPVLPLLDSLLESGDKKVLDIGAAYGTLSLYTKLWNCDCYCLDMTDAAWSKELESENGINHAICNIESEEIPWDISFDIIIFTEVLEHLNYNPLPVFNKFKKALVNGGHIILSTPWHRYFSPRTDWPDVLNIPYYQPGYPFVDAEMKYFTLDEILVLASNSGFVVKHAEIYNGHMIIDLVKL